MDKPNRLLQKYLAGQCTPAERDELYQYLRQYEAADFDPILRAVWQEMAEARAADPATSERMLRNITQRTSAGGRVVRMPRHVTRWDASRWLAAASLTGLFLLGGLLYAWYVGRDPAFRTEYGEVRTLTLPDQTVVYLNANSELSYSNTYATDPVREVWLDGEAYFKVTKQLRARTQQPGADPVKLIVHTPQIDVEVTGTAFNVNNRHGVTQVVLDEGKVHLKNPASQERLLAMRPGDAVQVNQQQRYLLRQVSRPDTYSSWKENELYFDDKTLGEIQQVLADNYGVRLTFNDPALRALRFTGSTPANNLSVLFTALENSFSLTITRNADDYYVSRKPD
jgi:ferric-dicitrate binding protein FerR (iron transport regulator)